MEKINMHHAYLCGEGGGEAGKAACLCLYCCSYHL